MDKAAANGHPAVVQYVPFKQVRLYQLAATSRAAESGHSVVVQWPYGHRREGCTQEGDDAAAANGHLGGGSVDAQIPS